ncbi:MAG: cupin domain-containing protein [Saprospiraceae bacterium]|nr:cupin domain-containing protein [Saprospiraceae bacterium]
MQRLSLLPCLFLLMGFATAQEPIPVYLEPYHHLVFENSEVRILDVRLQPGDTSQWHIHHNAITYIGLEGSRIWLDVPGEQPRSVYLPDDFWGGDIEYPEQPFVHRIANIGDHPFRLMAVEHLQPRSDRSLENTDLEGWEALDINPYFALHRLTLEAGSAHEDLLPGPGLLICRGKGQMLIQGAEGIVSLDHGNWMTWPIGEERFVLANTGTQPVEVLLLHL